jgi:dihydrofolate synthase/folylpolyglutamate synthase
MDWLGPDRDSIGREKAGIARAGRAAIVGETVPSIGLLQALAACGARVERAGIDFTMEHRVEGWRWQHRDGLAMELPELALAAPVQYANAATAIAAMHVLCRGGEPIAPQQFLAAVGRGMQTAQIPARLQSLGGAPRLVVDVGHNPQAARALAEWLDVQPAGAVHAVYGALADKDVAGVMAALGPRIAYWHLAGLDRDTPRGLAAGALAEVLRQTLPQAAFATHADVADALRAARADTSEAGQILAFGSFFVAGAVIAAPSG